MGDPGSARRNRISAAAMSLAIVASISLRVSDPERADALLYDLVFALGYGHLGAAAWRSTAIRGMSLTSWRTVLSLFVLIDAFVIYAFAVRAAPVLALGLLFVSTWHSIENDRGLPHLYRDGKMPKLHGSVGHMSVDAAWFAVAVCMFHAAGAVDALGVATWPGSRTPTVVVQAVGGLCLAVAMLRRAVGPRGGAACAAALVAAPLVGEELRFAEAFALVTLYHIASWAVFVGERAFAKNGLVALVGRAVVPHAAPLAILGALLLLPGADPWRRLMLSPGIYLFWSSLHVLYSAQQRRPAGSG